MKFNYIQSFIIKRGSVNGATQVFLTSVDLFFKNKPQKTGNRSGIDSPGATVYICPFKNDYPDYNIVLQETYAIVSWGAINSVSDASLSTKFTFETPIIVEPDQYYGIVVKFDDNDYELWTAVQNEKILNTTKIYSGTSGEGDGKLYLPSNQEEIRPVSDTDLKFNIRIAKFTANTAEIIMTHDNYEFFTMSSMSSNPKFIGGELVFQNFGLLSNSSPNTVYSKAGTIVSISGNSSVTGVNTAFTTDYTTDQYIILTNTSNTSAYHLAKISSIISNTKMELENPMPFSNTLYHMPVVTGKVLDRDNILRKIILHESTTSNSSIRFYSNAVKYFTVSNPGGSYSNNDTVRVSNGSINATASLITNATGNVVAFRLLTPGSDFPNASHSVVTITTSTGSGLSISPVIGAPLLGELSGATGEISSIDDYPIAVINSSIPIKNSPETTSTVSIALANTTNYIQPFKSFDQKSVFYLNDYSAKAMSRSREVLYPTNLYGNKSSFVYKLNFGVNVANVINTPVFNSPYTFISAADSFIFDNTIDSVSTDTSGEIGRGPAKTKHITKKITFANNLSAEDIRVYINAYKPANTEILIYAKIHNSTDSEVYDDKSWSPLELKDGINKISAINNRNDLKEYTYGFPSYPNVEFTCTGTGTSELGNTVILTTNDLTSNLAANDLIRIYNPLFSTTNYQVVPVDSVNSTAVILKDTVSNNGLVSSGLKIDKLRFKSVGFNNILNDNVVRYYTSSMVPFDTYSTVAVKVVLLSDNKNTPPEVDDIRVIGVSA